MKSLGPGQGILHQGPVAQGERIGIHDNGLNRPLGGTVDGLIGLDLLDQAGQVVVKVGLTPFHEADALRSGCQGAEAQVSEGLHSLGLGIKEEPFLACLIGIGDQAGQELVEEGAPLVVGVDGNAFQAVLVTGTGGQKQAILIDAVDNRIGRIILEAAGTQEFLPVLADLAIVDDIENFKH